jgi:Tfp pilus assembly protein FimT
MARTPTSRNNFNQRDAITLIEVLLVIGLIVLIASMAMPELLGTLRLQRLRSAADELRTDLS